MGVAKKNRIVCTSSRTERKLYIHASQAPLEIIGAFNCEVCVSHATDAEFCVCPGKEEPRLGKDTAIMLGVLKIA